MGLELVDRVKEIFSRFRDRNNPEDEDRRRTVFDQTLDLFLEQYVPRCLKHVDSDGNLKGTNAENLKQGISEVPYMPGHLIIYDGHKIFGRVLEMITGNSAKTLSEIVSLGQEGSYNRFMLDLPTDHTVFYDTTDLKVRTTEEPLKNYYKGIDQAKLKEEGLPNGRKVHNRVLAALLATKKYRRHNVGAVVVRQTLKGICGSVERYEAGRLVEEAFVRYNDGSEGAYNGLELVHRTYKPDKDGLKLVTEYSSPLFVLNKAYADGSKAATQTTPAKPITPMPLAA